jgi:hypothetical protein
MDVKEEKVDSVWGGIRQGEPYTTTISTYISQILIEIMPLPFTIDTAIWRSAPVK